MKAPDQALCSYCGYALGDYDPIGQQRIYVCGDAACNKEHNADMRDAWAQYEQDRRDQLEEDLREGLGFW